MIRRPDEKEVIGGYDRARSSSWLFFLHLLCYRYAAGGKVPKKNIGVDIAKLDDFFIVSDMEKDYANAKGDIMINMKLERKYRDEFH